MLPSRLVLSLLVALSAPAVQAAPRVVADIAPVHSLVAQVMDGVAVPELLLPAKASPHGYALRPSEAAMLQNADLIFVTSDGLTPWLARILPGLAQGQVVELAASGGMRLLSFRSGAAFEAHDHAAKGGAHDDHDDHGHEGHDDDHGQGEGDAAADPHIWLDPQNAAAMLDAIGEALSAADPANAARYRANADLAIARIAPLSDAIAAQLAPVRGRPFIVFHDAYHYFEAAFEIEAAGAVALPDSTAPGPDRVSALRAQLVEGGIVCVFAEPQFDRKLIDRLIEGTDVRVGILDPLGAGLPEGAAQYGLLIQALASEMRTCLE